MKTKERILWKALDLFNDSGVEKVTTRHIASELEMSQGNLHYHFPNKDALILALFERFLKEVEAAGRYVVNEEFLKESVFLSMQDNFKIMYVYRFLFVDNEVVWRRLPDVKTRVIELFEKKKVQIKEIIGAYKEARVFRSDISDGQIEYLANQFTFSISTWLIAAGYLNPKGNQAEYFARFTFRLWLPYLTKEEMVKWEAML